MFNRNTNAGIKAGRSASLQAAFAAMGKSRKLLANNAMTESAWAVAIIQIAGQQALAQMEFAPVILAMKFVRALIAAMALSSARIQSAYMKYAIRQAILCVPWIASTLK